jgi:hypothetical protein
MNREIVLVEDHPQVSALTMGRISVVNPAIVRKTSKGRKVTLGSALLVSFRPYLCRSNPTNKPKGICNANNALQEKVSINWDITIGERAPATAV